jgi:two-component system response regulator YesN
MKQQGQGYYRRLLVSYYPILFSVFTVLVLLILIGSTYLSRETVKKESLVMAKFINSVIDRELKAVEQMLYTELLDKKNFLLLTQLNPTHNSFYSTYELSVMLREIKNSNSLIDSIYIYRYVDQSVQTMNVTSTLERFGDRDFIGEAIDEADPVDLTAWSGIREYKEFDSQDPAKVISVMRPIPILRETGGLIVMNVSIDSLTRLVHHLSDPESTYVRVRDSAGQSLLESGSNTVMADAVSTSDYTGYTIRLGYREGVLNGILNTMVILYIACASIVVGFGLLWMMYITRRNYKPIQAIVSRLNHLIADSKLLFEGKPNKDEFSFVEQVLERMIEQSTEFEQQHKEHASIKRRMLFTELREGRFEGTPEESLHQLAVHEWDIDSGGFMLAVVEIDSYDQFTQKFNERDQSLLKFAMYNVIIEMALELHQITPWVEWVSANQIAAMYPVCKQGSSTQETITLGLQKASIWIEGHLKTTISIGIGRPVWEAKHISVSYSEAQHMLKFKFSLGNNRVIGYWEIDQMDRSSHMGLVAAARDLAVDFRLAVPHWEHSLDQWFDEMKLLLIPKEDIDMLLRCFVYHIRRQVSELSDEFLEVWEAEYNPHVERCMQDKGLVAGMGQELLEIVKRAGVHFAEMREANGHAVVLREVRTYIDQNYANTDLSLTLLSSTFEMNSKTLSRQFKEQFGENFVDYLMKRRIQAAKQLLLESETPIQQISIKVGYVNALSFTRAFKKMEGITPQELRKA